MDAATRIRSGRDLPGRGLRSERKLRLLITSAGRRVELLQCFRAAAAEIGIDLTVLACDLRPELSAACAFADRIFAVPPAEDPGYAEAVLALCAREGVSLLVPTIDPELIPLSEQRERFGAAGTEVAISSPELVAIARDKEATAKLLARHGIPSPQTARIDRAASLDWTYPILVKPRHGSASRGIRLISNASELAGVVEDEPLIVQQRLAGPEYTVNIFVDNGGQLRCAIVHVRLQVRAGEVEKGRTSRHPELEDIAARLVGALPGGRGALCFQAMADGSGQTCVFEINARFGGGYPLAHRAGANIARWLLEQRLGIPCTAHNDWREGVAMLRYDAAVFLEP